jgi:hypothetical protein
LYKIVGRWAEEKGLKEERSGDLYEVYETYNCLNPLGSSFLWHWREQKIKMF